MIPDPLHPAVVHFPVVLIMAGAVLALILWVRPGRAMALAAAIVLVLAAISSQLAVTTGEWDEEAGERASEAVFEAHEEAAEVTRTLAFLTAAAGIAAWWVISRGRWRRMAAVIVVLLALSSVAMVARAGHLGGKLVYQYGAGVSKSGNFSLSGKAGRDHHDDD